jgi:hypothetical protein
MNLVLHIPEPLAARLVATGASPEYLALAALRQVADELERNQKVATGEVSRRTPAEAAARMRASRAGHVLPEGVSIRDLLTDGRA